MLGIENSLGLLFDASAGLRKTGLRKTAKENQKKEVLEETETRNMKEQESSL